MLYIEKNKLYYVGLASNLRARLRHHLRDRHAGTWDRFSVYLTLHDKHLKELESLVIRIAAPKGNRQKGGFSRAEDLRRKFRKQVAELQKIELDKLFGSKKKQSEFVKRVAREGREPALIKYIKNIGYRIKMTYKGKTYYARVRKSGKIRFKKHSFNSPSVASSAILKRNSNGWYWWKYQRSPREWVRIDELRK
ncbi:hypothetical protein ACFL37_01215 [Candidatus Margulisiibacteriota bacterium]